MKPEYIKQFEKLGFGMFVHFGLYSVLGKGEWVYYTLNSEDKKKYFSEEFANKFNPKKDWATKLVKTAKAAGAKYITLTTKHHDGFFLYDSKGLTNWDSTKLGPKRDLVKEFVDACNRQSIIIKWELENMLTFANIPKKEKYKLNTVIDIDSDTEYQLDIFSIGREVVETGTQKLSLSSTGKLVSNTDNKYITSYDYKLLSKNENHSMKTVVETDKGKHPGIYNLFRQLVSVKNSTNSADFPDFIAVITGSKIAFNILGKLYIASSRKVENSVDIAYGSEIYAVDNDKVYFVKSKNIGNGVTKNVMYSCNLNNNIVHTCKIMYGY